MEHLTPTQIAIISTPQAPILHSMECPINTKSISSYGHGRKKVLNDTNPHHDILLISPSLNLTYQPLIKKGIEAIVTLKPRSKITKLFITQEGKPKRSGLARTTIVMAFISLTCLCLAVLADLLTYIVGLNYSMYFLLMCWGLLGISILTCGLTLMLALIWLIAKLVQKKKVEKRKQGGA